MITTIKKELNENGTVLFRTKGKSMEPIIHENSTVVCVKRTKIINKWDVVLFVRENKKISKGEEYVLHRNISRCNNGIYKVCGDNLIEIEHVSEDSILGVMVGFYYDGNYIDCFNNKKYSSYVRTWTVRYIYRNIKALLYRFFRLLKG